MKGRHTVMVGGVRTSVLSRYAMTDHIVADVRRGDGRVPRLCFDVNGHGLALGLVDADYRACIDQADLVHADGQPLVTASRWLTRSPIAERTATTDLFHDVAAAAAGRASFFLLGGSQEVNEGCVAEMRRLYPDLQIVGNRNGYFTEADEAAICAEINASGADIVWVGLGKPKEQSFCVRNRDRITASWMITCGGCFNFVTGDYKRAPQWMQSVGFEWLHRLAMHPRKLLWRYLWTTPIACALVLVRTRDDSVEAGGA